MTEPEKRKITELLITRALAGVPTRFVFLTTLLDLKAARMVKKSTRSILKSFKEMAGQAMHDYLAGVAENKENLGLLLSYTQLKKCINFYKTEESIFKDMITEYICYILGGHLLRTLLFNMPRPEEDRIDWRTQRKAWWW